jgi:hypothetical protein
MRFEDEIYFSKNYQWSSIDFDDKIGLLNKFTDRIQTLYLDQITYLNKDDSYYNSFAVGVLLFATIDFVGGYLTSKNGFNNKLLEFLKSNESFNTASKDTQIVISKKITESFRNGIIHNGRVKESCQFDYDFENTLFVFHDEILIINTKFLESLVEDVLKNYIDRVKTENEEMNNFINRFKNDFSDEIRRLM